jgi:membrane protease YdiL (CAAX protease family)
LCDGTAGVRGLAGQLARWRIGFRWWLVALGSPLALYAGGTLASRVVTDSWPDLTSLGEVNFLGNIGLWAIPLWVVTFGFGEETGWRGFAQERLQRSHSPLTATMVVGLVWLLWHLPAFFYLPTYVAMGGLGAVPGFGVGLLLGAVLLTWLYNGTGGSVMAVAVWHALYDLFSASQATNPAANVVMNLQE